MLPYKRIIYKISGEALMGEHGFGHDFDTMLKIAKDIKKTIEMGIEVCLVVGGGNICRGATLSQLGLSRTTGDHIGMLATVMNAIAMQNILEKQVGMPARVMSAISMKAICEPYVYRRALRHLEKKRIVIFAAGTGNPYFTTDTAATLRAVEMDCEAIFKGTSVDGVYSADPKKDIMATRLENITHLDVLSKELKFMDASAISLAKDNNIPILIFSIKNTQTPLYNIFNETQNFSLIKS